MRTLKFDTPVIDKTGDIKELQDFGGGELPIASNNTLGVVKIGEGISVEDDGTIHTTNLKPHGEYDGNGSTAERIVETGVEDAKMILLNAIAISTEAVTGSSLVFESGAIKFSSPTVSGMNAANVKIESGNIVMHTSDANFNAGSNLRYEWFVIV